jgi:hypothetical protein
VRNEARRLGHLVRGAGLAFLLTMSITACNDHSPSSTARKVVSSSPAHELEESSAPDPCVDAGRYRQLCHTAIVNDRAFRYLFIPGASASGTATVLDPGGPGDAVLGAGWPSEQITALKASNLVLLDEPWTTSRETPACSHAVTTWYTAFRRSWPGPAAARRALLRPSARNVVDTCTLFRGRWEWKPTTYRQVIASIEQETGKTIDAFVGMSFGSVRAAYLHNAPAHTTLVSPFPYGVDAHNYVRARAERAPHVPSATTPRHVNGRSIPVSEFDTRAAELQAAYFDNSSVHALLTRPSDKNIGRLSDMLFGRYGRAQLSPALLAYWEGTCQATTGWSSRWMYHSFLGSFMGVCEYAEPHNWPQSTQDPECVGVVEGDRIVPDEVVQPWLRKRGWQHVVEGHGAHAPTQMLENCLKQPFQSTE